jgi:hypothetical protein
LGVPATATRANVKGASEAAVAALMQNAWCLHESSSFASVVSVVNVLALRGENNSTPSSAPSWRACPAFRAARSWYRVVEHFAFHGEAFRL